MIGSHCPAQVSTLTWQILCEYRRGIEIVSEDNMSEIVNRLCQSDHHSCRQPHQFVDLSPVLAGVNLQVVAICCHCISRHPQLDARFGSSYINCLKPSLPLKRTMASSTVTSLCGTYSSLKLCWTVSRMYQIFRSLSWQLTSFLGLMKRRYWWIWKIVDLSDPHQPYCWCSQSLPWVFASVCTWLE